jgi:hypothetical protein
MIVRRVRLCGTLRSDAAKRFRLDARNCVSGTEKFGPRRQSLAQPSTRVEVANPSSELDLSRGGTSHSSPIRHSAYAPLRAFHRFAISQVACRRTSSPSADSRRHDRRPTSVRGARPSLPRRSSQSIKPLLHRRCIQLLLHAQLASHSRKRPSRSPLANVGRASQK